MSLLRVVTQRVVLSVAGALFAVDACTHNSTAPGSGSLMVAISSPTGVTPQVTVSGPGGYERALMATQMLTGLSPGSYVITATSVEAAGPIVSLVDAPVVGGSPAAVSDGRTANATVTYAPRNGSGALWVVGDIDTTTNLIYEFTPDQLQASGAPNPAVTLSIPHTPTK